MILVAPTEPGQLHAVGESSSATEMYGADILIPARGFLVGIQRKEFPGDFMSSLSDGRLSSSCIKLRRVDMAMLVLEGRPNWTATGQLVGHDYGQAANFHRAQLRAMLMSMQWEFGISTYWTDSLSDTVDFVRDVHRWAQKDRHDSLRTRAGSRSVKLRPTETEQRKARATHLLQGFDGVGPKLASDIFDHFGGLPLGWTVTEEELRKVQGIGEGRARKLLKDLGG